MIPEPRYCGHCGERLPHDCAALVIVTRAPVPGAHRSAPWAKHVTIFDRAPADIEAAARIQKETPADG